MGILRWILTISFVGIGLFLALVLGILLIGVYMVMRMRGALKTITVRVDERGRVVPQPSPNGRGGMGRDDLAEPVQRHAAGREELPSAPAGAEIFHMRAWDETQNRAIDRWYYKDDGGQWIFVQPPGKV